MRFALKEKQVYSEYLDIKYWHYYRFAIEMRLELCNTCVKNYTLLSCLALIRRLLQHGLVLHLRGTEIKKRKLFVAAMKCSLPLFLSRAAVLFLCTLFSFVFIVDKWGFAEWLLLLSISTIYWRQKKRYRGANVAEFPAPVFSLSALLTVICFQVVMQLPLKKCQI